MILFSHKVCLLVKFESDILQANKNLKGLSQRVQSNVCYLLTAIKNIEKLIWLNLQTCPGREINVPEKSGSESFVSSIPVQHLWFGDIYSKNKILWHKNFYWPRKAQKERFQEGKCLESLSQRIQRSICDFLISIEIIDKMILSVYWRREIEINVF